MAEPTLTELAEKVFQLAGSLSSALAAENQTTPGASQDGTLLSYPSDDAIQGPRMQLIDALNQLLHQAIGPGDYLSWQVFNLKHDLTILKILYQFNIFHLVPLGAGQSIAYAALAKATDLPEQHIRRILRHAMLNEFFRETATGEIEHTSYSAHAVTAKGMIDWLGHNVEESTPSALRLPEALRKFDFGGRGGGHTDETGWGLEFFPPDVGHDYSCFLWMGEDGENEKKGWRAKRFGNAMTYLVGPNPEISTAYVHKGYDWDKYAGASVLDIGGSNGHLSFEIASRHPTLKFKVADLPFVEADFNVMKASVGPHASQVSFLPHDFFQLWPTEQIGDVDIFLLRYIFHDWADQYVLRIIQNLMPLMRPGSRLFIIEQTVPEAGDKDVPTAIRKLSSSLDLQMWGSCNGRERAASDWRELLRQADPRFEIEECRVPVGSMASNLNVLFRG